MTILQSRLTQQRSKNLYRKRRIIHSHTRHSTADHTLFSSNDYLGLSQHPDVILAFKQAADQYGLGAGASQMVTGHTQIHHDLELAFADFLGVERCLLFSNGYMANMGILTTLFGHTDTIFEDKHNHASLIDGGICSAAKLVRYPHLQMNHLRKRLQKQFSGRSLIASDGVFSMRGDLAPLSELVTLTHDHCATLLIDEAHAFGVLGKAGKGSWEHAGLKAKDISILVYPLGKAFGGFGAMVAGSELIIENLIQFCRTYTYTTAFPPALAAASLASLQLMQTERWRVEKLQHLIRFFKQQASQYDLPLLPSISAIQPITIGDAKLAEKLSEKLYQSGFIVHAMRPPSVPDQNSLLRITLTAEHTEEQITTLLSCIKKFYGHLSS